MNTRPEDRIRPRSLREPEFRELLEERPGPAISIFLAAEGAAPDPAGLRLRLRAAIDRASALLAEQESADVSDLLAPLREIVDDVPVIPPGDALVIFRSPGFCRVLQLAGDLDSEVVVAPTFHTRPLIKLLSVRGGYWVLALGQGHVRLWRGNERGIRPIDPSPLPSDMDSALDYQFERDTEFVRRAAVARNSGAAGRPEGGGSVGAFSSHGVGDVGDEALMNRFFATVDADLVEYLGPDPDPVILAAVAEHHPRYRSVTRLKSLSPDGINASVQSWNAERLHQAAWPLFLESSKARTEKDLALWERSFSLGKTESDLSALGRLAIAGRVRTLLFERGRRIWGSLDRETGDVVVHRDGGADPAGDAVDVIDEIMELVLRRGGSATVLDTERMPTTSGVAGILR